MIHSGGRRETNLALLDSIQVTIAGEEIPLPEGGKLALAYLGLRRGPVTRRSMARQLWPEADDARAGGNLRSTLWRLRRAGIDMIDIEVDTVALSRGVRVDLDFLHSWSQPILDGTAPESALMIPSACSRVLNVFPGWYADWVIIGRERIRERFLCTLEVLSSCLSRRGRHAEAIEAAMTAVCAEPLRESAQRALVLAHAAEGNLAEAQRALGRYAALLWRDLGVPPSLAVVTAARAEQAL